MPSRIKSLCIFGDSHMASVKHALNQNLVKVADDLSVEFWGANGPLFRELDLIDGKIVPRPTALGTVLMVNGNGRKVLNPDDFDMCLFLGTRIRTSRFVSPVLQKLKGGNEFLSEAVFLQCCQDWLPNYRFYRAAQSFAESGKTKVVLMSNSLQAEDSPPSQVDLYPDAMKATKADRGRIWKAFGNICANDGITYIPQIEDTITSGCLTKAKYTRIDSDGLPDYAHRNAEYGALIMADLLRHC
jgi:hypothetical protein